VHWIHVAQFRDPWRALEHMIITFLGVTRREISGLAERLSVPEEEFYSMDLVT
jgi:hypothetical protein